MTRILARRGRALARIVLGIGTLALAYPIAAAPPPLRNSFSERLQRLTDLQRKAALRVAVLDNGAYCKRVETAEVRGPYKNLMMWKVTCDRAAAYGLFIGPDGTVQVRPCADLPKLKLPLCR